MKVGESKFGRELSPFTKNGHFVIETPLFTKYGHFVIETPLEGFNIYHAWWHLIRVTRRYEQQKYKDKDIYRLDKAGQV